MENEGTTGTECALPASNRRAPTNNRYFTGHPQFSTTRPQRQALQPSQSLGKPRTEARSQPRSDHRPEMTDRFDRLHRQ